MAIVMVVAVMIAVFTGVTTVAKTQATSTRVLKMQRIRKTAGSRVRERRFDRRGDAHLAKVRWPSQWL